MGISVGGILQKAREEKHFSLEDVAKFTKIHPRYLQALESGDYKVFSSAVHLQGFLKNYASFLGLSSERILAFYRREHNFSPDKQKNASLSKVSLKSFSSLSKNQLGFILFAGICFSFFVFLIVRYQGYAGAPTLKVERPVMGEIVSQEQISIEGYTDPKASLTLNDRDLPVNRDGKFSLTVNLLEGRNSFHLVATNKVFGKQTSLDVLVFYKPQ